VAKGAAVMAASKLSTGTSSVGVGRGTAAA
jgi:hypothetical protein